MKNINTPTAIIIGALIIAAAILLISTKDPLAKCMDKNIEVSIALRSNLLDANIDIKDKLYGYHRLSDPTISYLDKNEMNVCKWSEVIQQNAVPVGIVGRDDAPEVWLDKNSVQSSSLNGAPEPNKF